MGKGKIRLCAIGTTEPILSRHITVQWSPEIEVLLGYVMLGGLISILANKLARWA
jgi:hypothetical protein